MGARMGFLTTVLSAVALTQLSAADQGLTLRIWNNTGRAGPPASTSVVPGPILDITGPSGGAFSAELEGTIDFNASGVFEFFCNFSLTTTAFVWVDGHMICQDNHAYVVDPTVMDNPLPIQGMDAGMRVKRLPFRAHIMFNGTKPKPLCDLRTVEPSYIGCFNDTGHDCGYTMLSVPNPEKNSHKYAAAACAGAGYKYGGAEDGLGREVWCGHGPPNCPKLPTTACGAGCPGNSSETCGGGWALEALGITCTHLPPPNQSSIAVRWSPWAGNKPSGPPTAIPSVLFGSTLPDYEQEREKLQRGLAQGWGLWLHSSMLSLVSLPSAATVTTTFCPTGSNNASQCIDTAQPDGHKQNAKSGYVRVGHHAYDRSYVQYYVGHSDSDTLTGANASVELTVTDGGTAVDMLITPIGSAASWKDIELVIDGRFAWMRAGSVATESSTVTLTPAGMSPIALHSTTPGKVQGSSQLRVSLGNGSVGLSTRPGRSISSIQAMLKTASEAEEARLEQTFTPAFAGKGMAVKGSAMWNLIYNPSENGAALLPVSRDWNFAPSPANDDWTYAVFDWDNIFASLLAGIGNKTIAYSNLIQVIKSKTAAGFVPNFAAGGSKSMDRTEPPIGSKTLLELYKKYGDKWMVSLLFDDLLDWSNWFMRRRLLPPLDMVALGSFNEEADITGRFSAENMQGARFESGLDNSPMYDGEFYDSSNTFMMQLYDVGMSSMVVQEAYALAELADAIGRNEGPMLKNRGDSLSKLIAEYLWDEESQIYVNKFVNGSFYRRISPTSFYALQTSAPNDTQAAAMMEQWLFNKDRFCIAEQGDFSGLDDTCYWGLPSIQASDPAYPPLGYWRGYVWGPMAQLTHWSLQNYDHVPAVRKGRKALVKQMGALMMSQWNEHRHICENYNPHKSADTSGGDCSGTKFYHWGALTGLIELVEEGYW